jgi:hypothetical protein
MKIFLRTAALVLAAFFPLAACTTIPSDGAAVQCEACDTLWVRLLPASGAPGLYGLNYEKRWQACSDCEKLAMAYFGGARLPECYSKCGGKLSEQPVKVTR